MEQQSTERSILFSDASFIKGEELPFSKELADCLSQYGFSSITVDQEHGSLNRMLQDITPMLVVVNLENGENLLTDLLPLPHDSSAKIVVILKNEKSFLAQLLRSQGCVCCRYPVNAQHFAQELAALASGIKQPTEDIALEETVTRILHNVGISSHLRGFHYLRRAILFACKAPLHSYSMMHEIYPKIAAKYAVSPASVERSMRHAIESIKQTRRSETVLDQCYYPPISARRMTNTQFIAMIADWISLNAKKAAFFE